ncbi:MAG TPA: Uma2 family endonuclease [Blastocatellia bacterium]|nr:Uma2 family endonuclease [Blastocatellia bacterium]
MAQTPIAVDKTAPAEFVLNVQSVGLTEEQFLRLCRDNPEINFELSAEGELIIMPPTGMITGNRNSRLTRRVDEWAEKDGTGVAFDSSTLFTLPNGAKRSPDASWIKRERLEALSEEEKQGFAPICPDFVVELPSPSDHLSTLQKKMDEYIENGARLGWLLDPIDRRVHIYRPGHEPEILDDPETISGEPVLTGFVLNLREMW